MITVRVQGGRGARGQEAVPAFMLPDAGAETESLVLPLLTGKPGDELELDVDGDIRYVRIGVILQRGHEFERVSFIPLYL